MPADPPRQCEQCGATIRKGKNMSRADYAKRRYCGMVCVNLARAALRAAAADRRPQPVRVATLRERGWDERAACRDWPLAVFFGPDGEPRAVREERERRARGVCSGCPVRVECLSWAVRAQVRHGVWGATGEAERAEMIKRLVRA